MSGLGRATYHVGALGVGRLEFDAFPFELVDLSGVSEGGGGGLRSEGESSAGPAAAFKFKNALY